MHAKQSRQKFCLNSIVKKTNKKHCFYNKNNLPNFTCSGHVRGHTSVYGRLFYKEGKLCKNSNTILGDYDNYAVHVHCIGFEFNFSFLPSNVRATLLLHQSTDQSNA